MNQKKKTKTVVLLSYLAIIFVTISVLTFLSVFQRQTSHTKVNEGDVNYETIYAPMSFFYQAGVDNEKWLQLKYLERSKIFDIYIKDEDMLVATAEVLEQFFNLLKQEDLKKEGVSPTERFSKIRENINVDLSDTQLRLFIVFADSDQEKLSALQKNAIELCTTIYEKGLFTRQTLLRLLEQRKEFLSIKSKSQGKDLVAVKVEDIFVEEDLEEVLSQNAKEFVPDNRRLRNAFVHLLNLVLHSNLRYDPKLTLAAKEKAEADVPKQFKIAEVKKGEQIIQKGERISKEHIEKINALAQVSKKENVLKNVWGHFLIILLLIALFVTYVQVVRSSILKELSSLILFAFLTLFISIIARLIFLSPFSSYLVPVSAGAMLISIIFGFRIAFIYTLFISLLTGILMLGNFYTGLMGIFGGLLGAFIVKEVRHRSEIIKAGFLVGVVNFVAIWGISSINNLSLTTTFQEGGFGFLNGIISAGIVMTLLPLLEYGFGVVTNISLLELCDMQHPLLKEMISKADGSYHHSIIVSSLAEAAAEVIGANVLLVKVASYFHDIGKIENPSYYSENQKQENSQHEKLSPNLSSLVIIDHVKKGRELAKKYKLKKPIVDIIMQHHGTSLVSYFYQKALAQDVEAEQVQEQRFRYPGPKPQTKEAALIMLADSVEAASRSIQKPTPSKLQEMVKKIVNSKFIDGQLDECDLTLKDIHKIGEVFLKVLIGVYHSRIEYPDENTNNKSSK